MKKVDRLMIGAMALLLAGMTAAQTKTATMRTDEGATSYTVTRMTGEVLAVDGSDMLVAMAPSGEFRWFSPGPDRKFIVDGQPKTVAQLAPGTQLTAMIVTRVAPVTLRTVSITDGTVLHVRGRNASFRLDNGEVRTVRVPDKFLFDVDGKKLPVTDLKKGMKATAIKVVTEPITELSTLMEVTGKAPK